MQDAAAAAPLSDEEARQKRIRALQKKQRQIQELKDKRAAGGACSCACAARVCDVWGACAYWTRQHARQAMRTCMGCGVRVCPCKTGAAGNQFNKGRLYGNAGAELGKTGTGHATQRPPKQRLYSSDMCPLPYSPAIHQTQTPAPCTATMTPEQLEKLAGEAALMQELASLGA